MTENISLDKLEQLLKLMNWAQQGIPAKIRFNTHTKKIVLEYFLTLDTESSDKYKFNGLVFEVDDNMKDRQVAAFNKEGCLLYTVDV